MFIRLSATGSPDEFAQKMGVARSTLLLYLQELKLKGVPIQYSHSKKSYYYNTPGRIKFEFRKKESS